MSGKKQSKLSRSGLPEGTVTFLFTDIEGSTELLKRLKDKYASLLMEQRKILRDTFTRWNGHEVDTQGDAFFYSFPRATDAVNAAVDVQGALEKHTWPEDVDVKVRIGVHTGEPSVIGEGYIGIAVHRAARIGHIGHGRQVLLSETTADLVRDKLPEGVSILDLGIYQLKGLPRPERVFQLEIQGLQSEFPPLSLPEAGIPPTNLPPQPTPFVGRQKELKELDEMISDPDNRLISIVGAGGMGKTRLAISVAKQQVLVKERQNGKQVYRFPDGVFIVRLAPLESTEAIIPTIAEATEFQFYEGVDPRNQLLDFFRPKRLLLLMDNFEHLIGSALLLTEIVQTAPSVRILVTSREKLNLRGEVSYPLHGMGFPEEEEIRLTDMSFTAIELFLQLTKRMIPDFEHTEDDLNSIGRICRLVEGMPLGIELATGWMETLSPSEIEAEIQKSFDFLEGDMQDVPERHQSLRAVFDYTWKLLSNDEQGILKKVSVFRGGFTVEAARDVAGASFKQIQRLVNKSLLQRSTGGRFDLHGLLRQYTMEMLGVEEEVRVRNKHCDYYTNFLHNKTMDLWGGRLKETQTEVDNIRACCRWAISHERHDAIRKFSQSVLVMYHAQGLYQEARALFEQAFEALRLAGHKDPYSAIVRSNMGWFQIMTGDYDKGITNIRDGYTIIHESGNKKEMATANSMLFMMDRSLTDTEKFNLMEENLAISEEIAEPQVRIEAKAYIASLARGTDGWEKAENLYHEVLRESKASNHLRFISLSYRGLGNIAFQKGEYSKSKSFYEESLSNATEMDFKMFIGIALDRLSDVALAMEEYEEAEKRIQESLEIARFSGDLLREANSQRRLGVVAYEKGDYSESDKHYFEALKIYRRIDEQKRIVYITCELGNNAVASGKYKEAMRYFQDAFEFALQLAGDGESVVAYCIACVAIYLVQRDGSLMAIELATLTSDHPKINADMKIRMTKLLTRLQEEIPPEEFADAQERGRERDVLSTGKDIRVLLESGELMASELDSRADSPGF